MQAFTMAAMAVGLASLVGCGGSDGPEQLSEAEVIERGKSATVELWGKYSEAVFGGSGVVYNAEKGLVVTNQHVIDGLTGLQAKVGDKAPGIPAQVVGQSPCDDLAVVRLTQVPSGLEALEFGDSDTVTNGQHVTALGYPASFQNALQQNVSSTEGTVSNPRVIGNEISVELPRYPSLIQHQAPINPGNSGGPLLDDYGEVIGINTLSSAPLGNQGQYYAISSNQVKSVLPGLQRGEDPAYVGWRLLPLRAVDTVDLAGDLQDAYGGPIDLNLDVARLIKRTAEGLYVLDTSTGSPAREAEVYAGDLLQEIDDTPVATVPQVCQILQSAAPGQILEVDTALLTDGESPDDILDEYEGQLTMPGAK